METTFFSSARRNIDWCHFAFLKKWCLINTVVVLFFSLVLFWLFCLLLYLLYIVLSHEYSSISCTSTHMLFLSPFSIPPSFLALIFRLFWTLLKHLMCFWIFLLPSAFFPLNDSRKCHPSRRLCSKKNPKLSNK
jgi:hypothetical protein